MSELINKNDAASATDEAQPNVKFKIDYSGSFPSIYSNVARVTHAEHDTCIDFSLVSTPQDDLSTADGKAGGTLNLRVMAQVLIPHGVAENLIGVLYSQLDEGKKGIVLAQLQSAPHKGDVNA